MLRKDMKANMSIALLITMVLVLIAIFFMVLKSGGAFDALFEARTCEQQGGECIDYSCDGIHTNFECPEGRICCMEGS